MVYVYITNVSNLPDPMDYPEIMDRLPDDRKQKIMRYKQVKDRKQSLGAGLLLLKILELHGKSMGEIRNGDNGKPELEGICFNLSHSHDMVACAVSHKEVGLDIEKIEDIREKIAERFFTKRENEYLNRFTDKKKTEEFFRLWTMKESYMKMTGEGLRLYLNRIEFVFEDSVKVYRDEELCPCTIKEYDIPGYKLTVCAEDTEFMECLLININ